MMVISTLCLARVTGCWTRLVEVAVAVVGAVYSDVFVVAQ